MRASWPSRRSALAKALTASAKPPDYAKGVASLLTINIFKAGLLWGLATVVRGMVIVCSTLIIYARAALAQDRR